MVTVTRPVNVLAGAAVAVVAHVTAVVVGPVVTNLLMGYTARPVEPLSVVALVTCVPPPELATTMLAPSVY